MRTRRRIAALVVSAAALGVGFIAFPASSAAAPPVVPTCAFPATAGSDSCGTITTDGLPPSPAIGAAFENIKLGVRVRSQFSPATSETTNVKLAFDNDIAINLAGIPSCPSSELTGKNIKAAYEQCGPNADGNPPSEGNAYLSAPGNVSGLGSTVPPANLVACTMIFKGATNNNLTIYARAPVASATACNNPATNTGGSATVLFTGNLTAPASPTYKHVLTILNTHTSNPALDDIYATVTRGAAFRARCNTSTPRPHRMQGTWDYTAAGDPTDTHVSTHLCPH